MSNQPLSLAMVRGIADKDAKQQAEIKILSEQRDELLDALINLQSEIHKSYKMNVKKDYSLMLADSQASKAIHEAKEGMK